MYIYISRIAYSQSDRLVKLQNSLYQDSFEASNDYLSNINHFRDVVRSLVLIHQLVSIARFSIVQSGDKD
jgi:hypothetical protein